MSEANEARMYLIYFMVIVLGGGLLSFLIGWFVGYCIKTIDRRCK